MQRFGGFLLGVVILATPFAAGALAARLEIELRWAVWLVGVGPLLIVALAVRDGIRVLAGGESALGKGLRIGLLVVVATVVAGGLHLLGVMVYALGLKKQIDAEKALCLSSVVNLTRAALKYAEEHEGRLPSAETWCDDVLPYVKAARVFVCPAASELRCGFAYNAALSEVSTESIRDGGTVVLIFESAGGRNAAGGPELLPDEPRHLGGDAYGFADGHAAWMGRAYVEVEGGEERQYGKRPQSEDVRWEVGGAGM